MKWAQPVGCAGTHDYIRNGTTTLFAALNVLDGTAIAKNMQKHRDTEFINFLNAVNRQIEPSKKVHVILDNYATHKYPKVMAWLKRHQNLHRHAQSGAKAIRLEG